MVLPPQGCGTCVQALKSSGVRDPILLLDEVDKMGHDSLRGDPASALLEVLDPNQNQAFVDTYLSVPFNLSQVTNGQNHAFAISQHPLQYLARRHSQAQGACFAAAGTTRHFCN